MHPHRASNAARPYETFGWQGITLTVPADWHIVFNQGRRASGQVRLADESAVRLEVRWQAARGNESPQQTVSTYLARLSRRAAKEGTDLAVQRDLRLASPPDADVECYRWVADRQALAMLSRCRRCSRLVHLHLWGEPAESLKGLARTVFASLRDHPDDGTDLWRFLDVEFRTPSGLPLVRKSLQSGCVRMAFGGRSTRLEFVRVSLAETLLRRKSLKEWFGEFYGRSLKRRSYDASEATLKGHAGLQAEGRPWLLVNPLALIGRRRVLRAACWHCETSNRLFICRFDGPAAQVGLFGEAVAGFKCCPEAEEGRG